jgi:hypothetical protein
MSTTENAEKSLLDITTKAALLDGLKDPEKALKIIEEVQTSVTAIVTYFNEMKVRVEDLSKTCNDYEKLAVDNQKACIDLTQSIKHIHISLNAHREVLPPELEQLANELGKFVLSGGAIKAGVMADAMEKKA